MKLRIDFHISSQLTSFSFSKYPKMTHGPLVAVGIIILAYQA